MFLYQYFNFTAWSWCNILFLLVFWGIKLKSPSCMKRIRQIRLIIEWYSHNGVVHSQHKCIITPKRGLTPASSTRTSVTSLSHCRAKNILLHHFSSSAPDSAVQEPPSTACSYLYFPICLHLSGEAVSSAALKPSPPSSASELQRLIKDYRTIFIQQYQWRSGLLHGFLLSALWAGHLHLLPSRGRWRS